MLPPWLSRSFVVAGMRDGPIRPQVQSEESVKLDKLRALFPDYHSAFKDLMVDLSDVTADKDGEAGEGEEAGTGGSAGGVDARTKALGHMSDKQLSSVVARHCRIFLSLSARRRAAVHALLALPSSRRDNPHPFLVSGAARAPASCSDAERLVAFEDSYRASVLLADPTSRLSSSFLLSRGPRSDLERGPDADRHEAPAKLDSAASSVSALQVEEAFSASHLLALANAARLCRSGRSLLDDAAGVWIDGAASSASSKKTKGSKKDGSTAGLGGIVEAPWLGEGAAGRNVLLVDPLVNFHLDPNVGETRLADGPLAAVLRRVAELLGEFPGHGVLIQVCVVFRDCLYSWEWTLARACSSSLDSGRTQMPR